MAMIEKGMKPESPSGPQALLDTLKIAFGFAGAGIGFLIGTVLETLQWFDPSIELPLYIAPILISIGLSLAIFYIIFKNKLKD